MKFDSIKSRLLLMTLICVAGMSLLVVSQHYFTKQLISLNQQRAQLLALSQELLQMRRHEKDFLLRKEKSYVHKFNDRAAHFTLALSALSPTFSQFDLSFSEGGILAQSLHEYQQLFQQVVAVNTELGLTFNTGVRGKIATVEAQIGRHEGFSYGSNQYQLFSDAKLAVRSYQISQDSFYRDAFLSVLGRLKAMTQDDAEALSLLHDYQRNFEQYSALTLKLGVNEKTGLRGLFRTQAHDVEDQLIKIDKAIQPLILAQEERVQVYSFTIAILTSIVLILLLVKSFATFHRAFANFVMFFYRCKRQYQKIDTRQLGFAEFKSLAELANEMVESRRQTEIKLAKAEAELQHHQ